MLFGGYNDATMQDIMADVLPPIFSNLPDRTRSAWCKISLSGHSRGTGRGIIWTIAIACDKKQV